MKNNINSDLFNSWIGTEYDSISQEFWKRATGTQAGLSFLSLIFTVTSCKSGPFAQSPVLLQSGALSKIWTLQVSLGQCYITHCPVIVTYGSGLWALFKTAKSFYYLIISGVIWRFHRRWRIGSACFFFSLRHSANSSLWNTWLKVGSIGSTCLRGWLTRGSSSPDFGDQGCYPVVFTFFMTSWPAHGSLWLFFPVSISRNG